MAPVVNSHGALVFEPVTAATTIGLGGGAATLNLTDTELGFLSDGFSSITFGKSDAGNIDIDTTSFANPVTLLTNGEILDNSDTDLNMTSADAATGDGTVAPGQSTMTGILSVTGGFTFADSSTFEVEIGGTTAGTAATNHDQIDATGAVTIGTGVTLSLVEYNNFGGSVSVGDSFEIINRTGGGGMFNALAEGAEISADFLRSGFPAEITYEGGDGDDVVVTVGATLVSVTTGTLDVTD